MTNLDKAQAIEKVLRARYTPKEYPSLRCQIQRFSQSRPFNGISLLDGTPLFTNTLAKFLPLLYGGAELSVSICDGVPYDPKLRSFLAQIGIPVIENGVVADGRFDIIMDCDGRRAKTRAQIGVCELTRSGIYHYQNATIPVVLVDNSRIKEIETTLGTGNGYMRAMRKFGYTDWRNKRVIIFGYGKVGRGVAFACATEGAEVTVVDRAEVNVDASIVRHFINYEEICEIREAVAKSDHLITATGIRGAMKRYGLEKSALDGVTISAIGIEDEWLDALEPSRIVNNGEAVNFSLDEPTFLRYIDPTMALVNESALDLLTGKIHTLGISAPTTFSEHICLTPVLDTGLITQEIRNCHLFQL